MTNPADPVQEPSDTIEHWVETGLGIEGRTGWVRCGQVRLHIREWGSPGDPGVVLVHGSTAHTHWWDHIAPRLAAGRHVVALDLSGHGDSDWRPDGYRIADWAEEVLAVVEVASSGGAPVLVGHSMGAAVALQAALESAGRLGGLILLDSALRPLRDADLTRRRRRAERVPQAFESKRSVIEGFHTLPSGGSHRHLPALVRHIAETSVRRTGAGWTWKLDRQIFLRDWIALDDVRVVDVPALVVAAEHGMLSSRRAAEVAQRLGGQARSISIPLAGHHLMLDQPAALIACLTTALALWQGEPPAGSDARRD